jgi:hypothetical protein
MARFEMMEVETADSLRKRSGNVGLETRWAKVIEAAISLPEGQAIVLKPSGKQTQKSLHVSLSGAFRKDLRVAKRFCIYRITDSRVAIKRRGDGCEVGPTLRRAPGR